MTVHDSRYIYIWVHSMIYTSILSFCAMLQHLLPLIDAFFSLVQAHSPCR